MTTAIAIMGAILGVALGRGLAYLIRRAHRTNTHH